MSAETWKPVTGYEGLYEASAYGRIRSIDRTVRGDHFRADRFVQIQRKGKILRQSSGPRGYLLVSLSKDGFAKSRRVNVLVCDAFNGPPPNGMVCRHLDGENTNNAASNLKWGTHVENQNDRITHGTDLRGEDVSTAKLTAYQAAAIKAGMPQKLSKSMFGISKTQHYRIKRGDSWAHINAWMAQSVAVTA